jgi:hypothetical protein
MGIVFPLCSLLSVQVMSDPSLQKAIKEEHLEQLMRVSPTELDDALKDALTAWKAADVPPSIDPAVPDSAALSSSTIQQNSDVIAPASVKLVPSDSVSAPAPSQVSSNASATVSLHQDSRRPDTTASPPPTSNAQLAATRSARIIASETAPPAAPGTEVVPPLRPQVQPLIEGPPPRNGSSCCVIS